MNMHHITKSLFVGAAIAGIGMSSGRAELQLEESSKDWAQKIIRLDVDDRYDELRRHLPKSLNLYIRDVRWDLTDYESETTYEAWKEADVKTLFNSLFDKGGYLSRFKDAKDYLNASDDDRRKNLKEFLEAEFSFKSIKLVYGRFKAVGGKTLNLMLFLQKVASRLYPFPPLGSVHCYSDFDDEDREVLTCYGMVEEGEQAGDYLPKWSFIFNDHFIEEVTFLITEEAKQQINKK